MAGWDSGTKSAVQKIPLLSVRTPIEASLATRLQHHSLCIVCNNEMESYPLAALQVS